MSELQYVWYFVKDAKGEHRTTEDKVRECAEFYKQKTGEVANLCLLHPDMIGAVSIVDGIELRASKTVQVNNYMLATIRSPYPSEPVADIPAPLPSP